VSSDRSRRFIAIAAVAGVIVVVGIGLFLSGSPSEARVRRLDERRLEDLRQTSYAIDGYFSRHGRLPAALDTLVREAGGSAGVRDPVTQQPYAYRSIDSTRYELCATFDRPSDDDDETGRPRRWPADWSWAHPAGRHCFALETRAKRP
jgi:hypothetical protein